MMRFLLILTAVVTLTCTARAQSSEFGVSFGATEFWGELGGGPGNPDLLRHVLMDTEISQTRYAVGLLYRYNLSGWNSFRINGFFARIDGDDAKSSFDNNYSFFRAYRNLNFKSTILEFSAQYEQNFMRYQIGRRRYRFAPYGLAGVGVFYFNPKAKDGTSLRDLRTEGQGSSLYPDRQVYSLVQPCILLGLGFKYNISDNWSLGFEYGHRITFTDYIDDVSKTYPEYAALCDVHGGCNAQADQAFDYSVQSEQLNMDPSLDYITAPGQQRGDPSDYDHYIFTGVITLTYTVSKGKIYCPKF